MKTVVAASIVVVLLAVSFVHAASIDLASVANDGGQGNGASGVPAISANGRFVAFASDANDLVPGDYVPNWGTDPDVFIRDLESGTTQIVSASIGETGIFWRT